MTNDKNSFSEAYFGAEETIQGIGNCYLDARDLVSILPSDEHMQIIERMRGKTTRKIHQALRNASERRELFDYKIFASP